MGLFPLDYELSSTHNDANLFDMSIVAIYETAAAILGQLVFTFTINKRRCLTWLLIREYTALVNNKNQPILLLILLIGNNFRVGSLNVVMFDFFSDRFVCYYELIFVLFATCHITFFSCICVLNSTANGLQIDIKLYSVKIIFKLCHIWKRTLHRFKYNIYIYIYIHIGSDRGREREREKESESERETHRQRQTETDRQTDRQGISYQSPLQ